MIEAILKEGRKNIYFLIGHRGVGKTTFLKKIKHIYPNIKCIDLDEYIEFTTQKSIIDIFKNEGESFFRNLEHICLKKILKLKDKPLLIALGAGFNLDSFVFPPESEFIWIYRVSDQKGRIFLNRPEWQDNKSNNLPDHFIKIYLDRYEKRQKAYSKYATIVLELPEGFEYNFWSEIKNGKLSKGIVTLTSWFFEDEKRIFWINRLIPQFVEIRDDLISYQQYKKIKNLIKIPILFSIRHHSWKNQEIQDFYFFDIDVKMLESFFNQISHKDREHIIPFIISSHDQNPPLEKLKKKCHFLKWSPLIKNWNQVNQALKWQNEDPERHILAPRICHQWQNNSEASWIRFLLVNRQKLNYVRLDLLGSHPQQISWMQYLHSKPLKSFSPKNFFAVIGFPIFHSHSPEFHYRYVRFNNLEFYKIPVEKNIVNKALNVLRFHGLIGCAITAPLKRKIIPGKSINTLFFPTTINSLVKSKKTKFKAINTDILGLKILFNILYNYSIDQLNSKDIKQLIKIVNSQMKNKTLLSWIKKKKIIIFGGGGTLISLKKLLPHSHHLKSRTKDFALINKYKNNHYDYLIWASSPEANPEAILSLQFKAIIDLNYHEGSLAIGLAKYKNVPYLGGRILFIAQALYQQKFWSSLILKQKCDRNVEK